MPDMADNNYQALIPLFRPLDLDGDGVLSPKEIIAGRDGVHDFFPATKNDSIKFDAIFLFEQIINVGVFWAHAGKLENLAFFSFRNDILQSLPTSTSLRNDSHLRSSSRCNVSHVLGGIPGFRFQPGETVLRVAGC